MSTGVLVPIEEYLNTSYSPDCEYVDGVVLERNLGELDHSRLQKALVGWFFMRASELAVEALPEQRVQVHPRRFRVPDVCVVVGMATEQILTQPPLAVIEILSKDDTMERMQEKIDDYLAFGVPYVWVLNPRSRKAWVYTSQGAHEAKDGILRTEQPAISLPLADLFRV